MISEQLVSTLIRFGYSVKTFETGIEAADYLDSVIDRKTVGLGDSQTLISMKMHERLSAHNQVFDPAPEWRGDRDFNEVANETIPTDIFISSVNAIAETGELVNIDRRGNRVIGTLYGHEKLYLVAGRNKIVPTLEDAIYRARNVAAPMNASRRSGWRTPCAKTGRCMDCSSPDRLCNAMVIHFRKMYRYDTEILLIDEDLGY